MNQHENSDPLGLLMDAGFNNISGATGGNTLIYRGDEDDTLVFSAEYLNKIVDGFAASEQSNAFPVISSQVIQQLQAGVRHNSMTHIQPLPSGFMVGDYRIQSMLGHGGTALAYLATHIQNNNQVAIKEYYPAHISRRIYGRTMAPSSKNAKSLYRLGLERFLVEACILASFSHPGIVKVYNFFQARNTAYLVLEYVKGRSLKDWWPTQPDFTQADVLSFLRPLLGAVNVVHQAGFLHRDIKPANILVHDNDRHPVLLDFGAAAQETASAIRKDTMTHGYAPIEQYTGAAQGPWTDIYAIGATVYWMISGNKPLVATNRTADTDPMLSARALGSIRFSPDFLQAIDLALKPNPEDRPQNIAAFERILFA